MSSDLHALVSGFADVAAVYERGRPEYPPHLVDLVVGELGDPARPPARILDIGAGTGKLTRPLLGAGLDVVAVEPLQGMRAALADAVGADRVRDARAEALPFADGELGGAACADAFHWFDGARAADELARVLRPGAALVVMWVDNEGEHAWHDEVRAELMPLWQASRHPSFVEGRRAEALEGHPALTPVDRLEAHFDDELDRDAMLAWFASFSVVGALAPNDRAAFLERIGAILDRHGAREGPVRRHWRADVRVARRR